jgi:SWI/SNF-related matrix-associated actin-dependent regulator 1 of chromatin subfamily A
MKYALRDYQIIGRDFLKARKFALLGDAPGVGKTGQAIMAIDADWKVLIVCPASVKLQWQQMFFNWRGWVSSIINTSKDEISRFPNITILNYDLMIREPLLSQLLKYRFDLICYDEAHKLKSINAKRTKIALSQKYLRPRTDRIWFLTGTPVKNRTVDLFPILRSCAPEVLGPYASFLKFAYQYCGAYSGRFGLDTSGASHTEELRERLKPFMLRREKREVLTELPPRVVSKIDLECTPAVKKVIEEEEKKTIEQAGESDPAMFKLGEIARIRQAIAKYKVPVSVDYIKDLLDEEDKIVVFYYHREVLHGLQRALHAIPSVFIDGSVAPGRRRGIVERFGERKEIRLFFGQMEACGEGIDGLQKTCSCCVFVEPSWSHTDIEQCIGRLERSGQRNDINVHILVIKDTLESRMMDVVAMKLNVDKKLYNQKEKKMADPTKVLPKIVQAAKLMQLAISNFLDLCEAPEQTPAPRATDPAPQESPKGTRTKPAPVEVEPVNDENEVTEDAVRARAGDICALSPKGEGKNKCIEIVKKIGGGKITDLKTPEQRKRCLAALDKVYNDLQAAQDV